MTIKFTSDIAAHIPMVREELVEREEWISKERFNRVGTPSIKDLDDVRLPGPV